MGENDAWIGGEASLLARSLQDGQPVRVSAVHGVPIFLVSLFLALQEPD